MPPIKRTCEVTGKEFEVSEIEQKLREKFGVELPDVSPDERLRYLMNFRNTGTLSAVTCGLCKQPTLSVWGTDPKFPVYCKDCFYGDNWSPAELDLDLERPFFEQFEELDNQTPHLARHVVDPMENSEYTNACTGLKDCYMSYDVGFCESAYYCVRNEHLKNCVDVYMTRGGEFLYDSLACTKSYQVKWSEFAINCSNSLFLYDCIDANDCAFSTGLRHKQYVFMNEQLTKDEYEAKIAELNTGSWEKLQEYKNQFQALKQAYPKKAVIGSGNDNVTGNVLYNSRDVVNVYDGRDLENCANLTAMWGAKDCLDVDEYGFGAEQVYSSSSVGGSANNIKWCSDVYDNVSNMEYCIDVSSGSHDCFGCSSGRKMEYSILNKKYSKEEYQDLREKLIEKMKERGEYGQMFPRTLMPFSYNESDAMINMPITQQQAEELGYYWKKLEIPQVPESQVLKPADDIASIDWAEIEGKFIICEKSGRPFKIIKQEFDFYKEYSIPLPRLHPRERLIERYPNYLFFGLHEAECSNCKQTVTTSMPPEGALLCDECYRETVA